MIKKVNDQNSRFSIARRNSRNPGKRHSAVVLPARRPFRLAASRPAGRAAALTRSTRRVEPTIEGRASRGSMMARACCRGFVRVLLWGLQLVYNTRPHDMTHTLPSHSTSLFQKKKTPTESVDRVHFSTHGRLIFR